MTSARPDVPENPDEGSVTVRRGPRSVVLAGGGSAGHVSPLLALADALRRRNPSVTITALGTSTGLEQRLVPERGYPLRSIPKVAFPRKAHVDALRLPAMLKEAVDLSGEILDEVSAEVVVGFGGYVSSPAYLAAKKRGIPIVIHEQNARPGLANRLGARLTPYVATTFTGTDLAHARVVGMPLRREITGLDRAAERARAREHFGLEQDGPVLLVTGGSLGAAKLNSAFAEAVEDLSRSGIQVLHVTGLGKEFVPEGTRGTPYVVLPYVDRMDLAYAAADLVVCRSGANTVCELAAVGLPAIFVPLPIGNGEQRFNAADVQAAGGCLLFDDADVNAFWVRAAVLPLLRDELRCLRMAEAMMRSGRRDGDDGLADLVYEAWQESTR
ncbi:undecaprenyldiphospho-muramoylpentapeptide beta-N-acetylglucosaminyltransferase [Austwickia chelonae]|uniref:undecaprenyldiphospho-muramoylpentapeptide beta-N-acetylglucosaminyltransferase n=1 Tax=Austwickia chelonae TaxID=100225 RepID=UPI000E26147F|nr:undecaprenyldiphospho-muramoylpentapeptide beta-N-acetylglucosaminyltransferase [Austwickia chelonae]